MQADGGAQRRYHADTDGITAGALVVAERGSPFSDQVR